MTNPAKESEVWAADVCNDIWDIACHRPHTVQMSDGICPTAQLPDYGLTLCLAGVARAAKLDLYVRNLGVI